MDVQKVPKVKIGARVRVEFDITLHSHNPGWLAVPSSNVEEVSCRVPSIHLTLLSIMAVAS